MTAVPSLLRVMTLRDAEAIVLESGKVPTLRRRGQVEQLAMPPLEGEHLADFATPLLNGRSVDEGPALVAFHDPGGGHYQVTIEKTAAGLRVVVRPGRPPSGSASATASRAPAAKATGSAATAAPAGTTAAPAGTTVAPGATAPAPDAAAAASAAMSSAYGEATAPHATANVPHAAPSRAAVDDALTRLAALLSPIIALARDRGASDAIISMGTARLRVDGQLESLDLHVDDDELAAIVGALGSSTDHSLELLGTRLRVNLFDHLGGAAIAARLIRDRVPSLAELGLPPELASVIEHRDGLVLVCGPTGSGKSTTLA